MLFCLAAVGSALPNAEARSPTKAGAAFQVMGTSYHAPSDSYFRLVQDFAANKRGVTWDEARERAAQMSHQGRAGRLAIVRDPHMFKWVQTALPLDAVTWGGGAIWIGLRYWCGARQLFWTDMKLHPPAGFAPWMVPWNRSGDVCAAGGARYMGVYHLGGQGRWQAVAPAKRFPHYLVQFPPAEREPTQDQSAGAR